MVRRLLVFSALLSIMMCTTLAGLCPDVDRPGVETLDATNVSSVGATLNGELANMAGNEVMVVLFRWGTSPTHCTNRTPWQYLRSSGQFSAQILGPFNMGSTYYFYASAEGFSGSVESFTVL